MLLQPLTKADSESEPDNWSGTGSVCFHLSLWMNSQSSCVTLHPAAQHLAWFASKNFVSFSRLLHSKWFLLAIAGRIVMQGGLWWTKIIEEVRQALAVWDTSICLCTHTEEPKNEPKLYWTLCNAHQRETNNSANYFLNSFFNISTKYLVVYKMANGVSNIIWTDPNGIK